ncbi:hypothetical protein BT96DRAFT_920232, partial [Gymnopus androsaceus JB14]
GFVRAEWPLFPSLLSSLLPSLSDLEYIQSYRRHGRVINSTPHPLRSEYYNASRLERFGRTGGGRHYLFFLSESSAKFSSSSSPSLLLSVPPRSPPWLQFDRLVESTLEPVNP